VSGPASDKLSRQLRSGGLRRHRGELLLLFASCLFAIAVGEMLLRLVAPPWLVFRMSLLNVGKRPEVAGSDAEWKVVTDHGFFRGFQPRSKFQALHYEYAHDVSFDEFGGLQTRQRSRTNQLVPVLGDSFTLGIGVADEETFVSLWSQTIRVRFLNLGLPGSSVPEQLQIARLRHNELGRPARYIFVTFLGNDIPALAQEVCPADIAASIRARQVDGGGRASGSRHLPRG
jgi:hypothetical protein